MSPIAVTATLRPEQASVVERIRDHPVAVVAAGVGTGKTYTTIASILTLLADRHHNLVRMDQFVLITFSRAAVAELRAKLD